MSCITCKVSQVTCHQYKPQQPQPQTLPLITPLLCTEGWFGKNPNPKTKEILISLFFPQTLNKRGGS